MKSSIAKAINFSRTTGKSAYLGIFLALMALIFPKLVLAGGCSFASGFEEGEGTRRVFRTTQAIKGTGPLTLSISGVAQLTIAASDLAEGSTVKLSEISDPDHACDFETALVGVFGGESVIREVLIESSPVAPTVVTLNLSSPIESGSWQAFGWTVSRGALETDIGYFPLGAATQSTSQSVDLAARNFSGILNSLGQFESFIGLGKVSGPANATDAFKGVVTCPAGLGPPLARAVVPNSHFGLRLDPVGGAETRLHHGTDYPIVTGENLLAMAAGSVVYGVSKTWGNYAIVTHANGSKAVYAHLQCQPSPTGGCAFYVNRVVVKGEVIGFANNSGRSTGSHLHLELIPDPARSDLREDIRIDPYSCHAECGTGTVCAPGVCASTGNGNRCLRPREGSLCGFDPVTGDIVGCVGNEACDFEHHQCISLGQSSMFAVYCPRFTCFNPTVSSPRAYKLKETCPSIQERVAICDIYRAHLHCTYQAAGTCGTYPPNTIVSSGALIDD